MSLSGGEASRELTPIEGVTEAAETVNYDGNRDRTARIGDVIDRLQEWRRRRRNYARIDKIKGALAGLSDIEVAYALGPSDILQKRLSRADEKFDRLVYPPGMNSRIAREKATPIRLSVSPDGELQVEELTERADAA